MLCHGGYGEGTCLACLKLVARGSTTHSNDQLTQPLANSTSVLEPEGKDVVTMATIIMCVSDFNHAMGCWYIFIFFRFSVDT